MSYTVLARKYRSQTFDDLVGQEAIATTLKNAVASERVHHGYLFTGTRGVGKTSTARVLAKALNCASFEAPTPTPCGTCEPCRMIAEGEDIDVIEIDAASNTGVDNIRDLRNNTAYRPARSRFKVYIIDEVHMLSTGAFNALLKTLEEPPDHVKFILATTEAHKVPATIVSRCQRFDFRSISIDAIAGHLRHVLEQEKVEADDTVIRRIARLAQGSMRDALSLLDQLLSFGGGKLAAEVLDDVLPVARDEVITALVDHVADEDAAAALQCVEQSLASGQTAERFCQMLIDHLRTLMLLKVCGTDTELVDLSTADRDQLAEQAPRFDASTYVYMISLAEEARRSVKSSNASRALIDAAVVRLALAGNFSDIKELLNRLEDGSAHEANPTPAARQPAAKPAAPATPLGSTQTPKDRTPACGDRPSGDKKAKPAGSAVSAVAPTPSPGARRRESVSSSDEARVRRDPTVQRTMELFDATLMSVQKSAPNQNTAEASPGQGDSTPDTAEPESAGGDA
ncbi:MAG: DNA polymerase III subunit gamma/tau [Phycisphaerae bacterium]